MANELYAGMSNAEKGYAFEEDFAQWLKEEKDYDKARTLQSDGSSDVDIHAEKYTTRSKTFHKYGKILLLASLFCFFWIGVDEQGATRFLSMFTAPSSIPTFLMVVAGLGIAFGMYGKKQDATHAWVECKNWSSRVDKDTMRSFVTHSTNLAQEADEETDTNVMFASHKGFTRGAKDVAKREGIECYRQGDSRNAFTKVDL